ncbi:MAG: hypothetical protein ABW252_11700 [Polyangiales bacterium]
MASTTGTLRVQYVGLRTTPELKAQVEAAAANLEDFRHRLEDCALSVGRWYLHHDQGHVYRVSLEISLPGAAQPLTTKAESPRNAGPDALEPLLHEAFEVAAVRLGALLSPPSRSVALP